MQAAAERSPSHGEAFILSTGHSSVADANVKTIFISSTVEDLKLYRAAAKEAIVGAGHAVDIQQYWSAEDRRIAYDECMARIDKADALVPIVAHRYGRKPPNQPKGDPTSITWLECLRAAGRTATTRRYR